MNKVLFSFFSFCLFLLLFFDFSSSEDESLDEDEEEDEEDEDEEEDDDEEEESSFCFFVAFLLAFDFKCSRKSSVIPPRPEIVGKKSISEEFSFKFGFFHTNGCKEVDGEASIGRIILGE